MFTLKNGANYYEDATSTFTVTGAGTIAGTAAEGFVISSSATLAVTTANASTPFVIAASFDLYGALNLNQGGMQTGQTSVNGTATLAASSNLELGYKNADGTAGLVTLLPGASIGGTGTTAFSQSAVVTVIAGVDNTTTTIGTIVNDNADKVQGDGTLVITGTYNWYNSTWTGSGTMQVGTTTAAGTLNILKGTGTTKLMDRNLVNYGTVTWSGNIDMNVGAEIQNMAGALFDIQLAQQMPDDLPAKGSFYNYTGGTLRKDTNTGQLNFNIQYYDRGGRIDNKAGFGFGYKVAMDHQGEIDNTAGATMLCNAGLKEDAGAIVDDDGVIQATSVECRCERGCFGCEWVYGRHGQSGEYRRCQ